MRKTRRGLWRELWVVEVGESGGGDGARGHGEKTHRVAGCSGIFANDEEGGQGGVSPTGSPPARQISPWQISAPRTVPAPASSSAPAASSTVLVVHRSGGSLTSLAARPCHRVPARQPTRARCPVDRRTRRARPAEARWETRGSAVRFQSSQYCQLSLQPMPCPGARLHTEAVASSALPTYAAAW